MAQPTAAELRGVFPVRVDNAALLTFLRSAHVLVGAYADCFAAATPPMTADEIHEVELYLAAHILVATNPTGSLASYGITSELRETYTGKFGMALQSTRYGQLVLTFDRSGCMAAADAAAQGKLPAQLRLIHQRTDPSESF